MKKLALSLAVAFTLAAPVARAQGTDPAAADALFQKGREAADKGDWSTACPKFAESQRLDPAPGTLLNLADCEEHTGQLALAYGHFKAALETLPSNDDRISYVKQRLAAVEKTLPHLTLSPAPGLPSDVKVKRDDVELSSASFGLALPVDPGTHVITVTAAGHADKKSTIALKAGESLTFTVAAGDETSGARSAAGAIGALPASPSSLSLASAPSMPKSTKSLGYVLGGVGAAGIVVGAVTGLMVLGKKSTVDDPAHCDQATHACDAAGVDAASSGKSLSTISTIAFVGGAAALGAGAYFVLTSKDNVQTATLVGPGAMASGAGVRLIHAF